MQSAIERGLIGDFREPNILRFGIAPLYLDETDIVRAAEVLEEVMGKDIWRESRYQTKGSVT